ncbi:MAG: hypothetical protein JRJ87_23940 [Deltaproteobacteria bacterium]|nr:hypothetical protein [Deltaproteobacteria bacterium]
MYPKRINFWSLWLVLFALLVCLPIQAAQWVDIGSGDPLTTYHDVYFTDANHGWIVGENLGGGIILRTINGGFLNGDWTEQTTTGAALWKLFFLDSLNGWAVGDDTTIMYTSDGGDSWSAFPTGNLPVAASLRGVYFQDVNNGWVAVSLTKQIYRTSNAGVNWVQDFVFNNSNFQDIVFTTATNGWAVGTSCLSYCIHQTTDGSTWDYAFPPPPSGNELYGLAAIADNNVWAAGDHNGTAGIYNWNGANWTNSAHPGTDDLRDIHFAGATDDDGWAVGLNSFILHREGAVAWAQETAPTAGIGLESVYALDSLVAFAVGDNGTIFVRGCQAAADCDDGDDCTQDLCDTGSCSNPLETDGTLCTQNGSFCDGPEQCFGGICTSIGNPCSPESECNFCNEGQSNCFDDAGTVCTDDGIYCNGAEVCDGVGGCAGDGNPCLPESECNFCNESQGNCFDDAGTVCTDDGTYCNGAEFCDGAGACAGDGNPCLPESECNFCNEGQGNCFDDAGTACTDDGTYCNGAEFCDGAGACAGDGNPCLPESECNFCNEGQGNCFDDAGTACTDDGTYCNGGEFCDGAGACAGDGNPCLPESECNFCNEGQGNCFDDAGTVCTDDGTYCNGGEFCDGVGACAGDGNPCLPESECQHCNEADTNCIDPDASLCDDGLYCSDPDTCTGGICSGPTRDCTFLDDDCNTGSCNEGSDQCDQVPANEDLGCDDGLYCTDPDTCTGGICSGPARNCSGAGDQCNNGVCDDDLDVCEPDPVADGTLCDDALFCTVTDICTAGVCDGAARDCSFLDDGCNNGICDDGDDQCEASPFSNGTGCEDGEYCTVSDTCQAGVCTAGGGQDCSAETDQCNDGLCDEVGDTCYADPVVNGTLCDNADPCTENDVCTGGVCIGGPPTDVDSDGYVWDFCGGNDCDDDDENINPGVFEAAYGEQMCDDTVDNDCDLLTDGDDPGCQQCAQDSDCDDNNVCNGTDTCNLAGGTCQSGTPLTCDDGNECTDNNCDPANGCEYPPNSLPCDDGLYCTVNSLCDAGSCVGTGNPCTAPCLETCREATESCEPSTDGTQCIDGEWCTVDEVCESGVCMTTPYDCTSEDDQCNLGICNEEDDRCEKQPTNEGLGCDDGLYCSRTDLCTEGTCEVDEQRDCSQSVECNYGVCDENLDQCTLEPLADNTNCDNGNRCTDADTCQSGICQAGSQISCNDNDECTDDARPSGGLLLDK